MNNFQVVLINPCPKCKEDVVYYTNLLKGLWEKLRSFVCVEKPDSEFPCYGLPATLFKPHKQFLQLVLPNTITGESNERETKEDLSHFCGMEDCMLNLSEDSNPELKVKTLFRKVEKFFSLSNDINSQEKYSHGRWSENIAEQVHQIADQLPNSGYVVNIYWLICGHTECVNISNHIALYGALRRLQTWNNAQLTWIFDSEEELCNSKNHESWNEELDITLINIRHITEPLVDNNIVWYGSLSTLEDQLNTNKNLIINSDWHLSRGNDSATLQLPMSNLNSISESEDIIKISGHKQELLKDRMTIICELNQHEIPLWKIFPTKFILYHKTKFYEKLSNACGEFYSGNKGTILLASLESCHNISFPSTRTTEKWIEFVNTGLNSLPTGSVQPSAKTVKMLYLLLYPLEPGIFHVYFLRPENTLCNFHSMLSVYGASVSVAQPATEVVDELRIAVNNLPRLSVELFENWLKTFDNASFLSFTKRLSEVKCMSRTELWETFLTSYTEVVKIHSLSNWFSSNEEAMLPSDCSAPANPLAQLYQDVWPERQWLKTIDSLRSLDGSPVKNQFSLAVHLDANEMLKHFTKDGKPMKKELGSLKRQIEKINNSPAKQQDIEKRRQKMAIGIDYCVDSDVPSSSTRSFSPQLFPKHVKHETLSICNTPKTLAMAKLQGAKRKAKSESICEKNTDEVTRDMQPSTSKPMEHLNGKEKKAKSNLERQPKAVTKQTSMEQARKVAKKNDTDIDSKQDCSTANTKLKKSKKRRSYDGSETAPVPSSDPNTKEKRSDRHKRRLARVVKRSLVNYGVDPTAEYYKTCSERLYYLCKSFLKDLATSEGLNSEMKRLAESNVANVVEFEKRRQAPKQDDNKS